MKKLSVSIFSDEVANSLAVQIAFAKKIGSRGISLRFLDPSDGDAKRNIITLSRDEATEVKKRLSDAGLHVTSLGSPIGKRTATIHDGRSEVASLDVVMQQEVDPLLGLIDVFGPVPVRVFGGNRLEECPFDTIKGEVCDQIGAIAARFEAVEASIELENEPWTATALPREVAYVCQTLGRLNVTAVFDEANAWAAGFKDDETGLLADFHEVVPFLSGLHIKRLNANDPALVAGRWSKEADLRGFDVVGGGIYDAVFRRLALRAGHEDSGEARFVPDLSIVATLEPHLTESQQFFGRSDEPDFIRAAKALHAYAAKFGFTTDFDAKALEAA